VRGGGLILSHAAGGREIARHGWLFGAKLSADWFQDEYYASTLAGNSGQFAAGTAGTAAFDDQTLPERDSSAYFIRKLMFTLADGWVISISRCYAGGQGRSGMHPTPGFQLRRHGNRGRRILRTGGPGPRCLSAEPESGMRPDHHRRLGDAGGLYR
jgi:hypothetical protein